MRPARLRACSRGRPPRTAPRPYTRGARDPQRHVDRGVLRPVSIAFTLWRLSPTVSARAACERPRISAQGEEAMSAALDRRTSPDHVANALPFVVFACHRKSLRAELLRDCFEGARSRATIGGALERPASGSTPRFPLAVRSCDRPFTRLPSRRAGPASSRHAIAALSLTGSPGTTIRRAAMLETIRPQPRSNRADGPPIAKSSLCCISAKWTRALDLWKVTPERSLKVAIPACQALRVLIVASSGSSPGLVVGVRLAPSPPIRLSRLCRR